ncbi:electron transfer flavoprotein subunit alpha/FixB family protein [Buttiauxella sp. B2]|uniref:electron transfer flavoprotein subunit alpha/FixB family protein n=1 Tax=Buttiauxella sp. B2 TaxID=2587812 RepID=UPI00111CC98E|nr:FAD-binding protein [Buttiauxella sp. B2]TNV10489.1 electron transfer flavoprotein subunit alpha/FixB family protein [Buttiauxella sp. B2]
MPSLIIAEHNGCTLLPSTRATVTAAKYIDDDIHLLVMGDGIATLAHLACQISGVAAVFMVDAPILGHLLAENVEQQISTFLQQQETTYQAILFPASTFGKNCAPRLAAKLDVFQISDITAVIDPQTFERPIYAGNAVATVRSEDKIKVITVRPTAFEPAVDGGNARVEHIEAISGTKQAEFISQQVTQNSRPDLQAAKIIVSGGRALGSASAFAEVVEKLADTLGAAVGASRAAVDAGYAPNDYQIGQTGKIVAPQLYIALGISGAIQHIAGMKESAVVVAINKDPDAPIFAAADYGLVADLFAAVPELIEKLPSRH